MNTCFRPLRTALRPLLLLALLLLTACSKPVFQGTDLTGASFGGDFVLQDHRAKAHRLADDRGKVVALFFLAIRIVRMSAPPPWQNMRLS